MLISDTNFFRVDTTSGSSNLQGCVRLPSTRKYVEGMVTGGLMLRTGKFGAESTSLPKHDSDGVALRKRPESSAVARMGTFGHDFPVIPQHTCDVPIHCLHGGQEPLSVVFPGPISLVRKGLNFHGPPQPCLL